MSTATSDAATEASTEARVAWEDENWCRQMTVKVPSIQTHVRIATCMQPATRVCATRRLLARLVGLVGLVGLLALVVLVLGIIARHGGKVARTAGDATPLLVHPHTYRSMHNLNHLKVETKLTQT